MALKVKVGAVGILDMLKFKNTAKAREKVIEKTPGREITGTFPINTKAQHLHPGILHLVIADIIEHKGAASKTYVLTRPDGKALPFFRAGQYLSVNMKIGESTLSRAYSLSSSPLEALSGRYEITVRSTDGGFASEWILSEWKKGDRVITTEPVGQFYYEDLRDGNRVLAVAGGSGITPFLSMAKAVRDGIESFSLTILYGSRTESSILFRDELEEIASSCPSVRVIHVLSDEDKEGMETGSITSLLIRKYAPRDGQYSLFFSGPGEMYRFLKPEVDKLTLPDRLFRHRKTDVTKRPWERDDFPREAVDKVFTITVRQGPEEYTIRAASGETVLTALERAGIKAPSRCRSGECGWCRSRLLSGSVYTPEENEGRRWADREYGYIHPCASFPLSDLVLDIPGGYW